ncbi:hypothetical protein ACWGFF_38585, partial [Streptomyces sp. NPDC054958]
AVGPSATPGRAPRGMRARAPRGTTAPCRSSRRPRQRDLLDAAGLTEADLADLTALGPVRAVKWKQDRDELPGSVAIEDWRTDDGLRFLEVSVRSDIADAAEIQARLEQALRERDITPPPFGETKTLAVMTALAGNALA